MQNSLITGRYHFLLDRGMIRKFVHTRFHGYSSTQYVVYAKLCMKFKVCIVNNRQA